MSSEVRFFPIQALKCPICGAVLELKPRKAEPQSMKLVHPQAFSCPRSGKVYYAPGVSVSEMPVEFQ